MSLLAALNKNRPSAKATLSTFFEAADRLAKTYDVPTSDVVDLLRKLVTIAELGKLDSLLDSELERQARVRDQMFFTSAVYYRVVFCDDDDAVPELIAYVYLHTESAQDNAVHVFQDARHYRVGDDSGVFGIEDQQQTFFLTLEEGIEKLREVTLRSKPPRKTSNLVLENSVVEVRTRGSLIDLTTGRNNAYHLSYFSHVNLLNNDDLKSEVEAVAKKVFQEAESSGFDHLTITAHEFSENRGTVTRQPKNFQFAIVSGNWKCFGYYED